MGRAAVAIELSEAERGGVGLAFAGTEDRAGGGTAGARTTRRPYARMA